MLKGEGIKEDDRDKAAKVSEKTDGMDSLKRIARIKANIGQKRKREGKGRGSKKRDNYRGTKKKELQATQGYEIVSESMLKTMSQYDDGKSENLTYELATNLLENGHHIWIWMSLTDAEGNPRKKWKLPFEEWICMHIHKYKAGESTPDPGFVDLKTSARGRNKYPVKLVWEQYYTGPGNGWWALEKTTTVKVS